MRADIRKYLDKSFKVAYGHSYADELGWSCRIGVGTILRGIGFYNDDEDILIWQIEEKHLRPSSGEPPFLADVMNKYHITLLVAFELDRPVTALRVYGGFAHYPVDIKKMKATSKFPHTCPRCASPAYIGMIQIECSTLGCDGVSRK